MTVSTMLQEMIERFLATHSLQHLFPAFKDVDDHQFMKFTSKDFDDLLEEQPFVEDDIFKCEFEFRRWRSKRKSSDVESNKENISKKRKKTKPVLEHEKESDEYLYTLLRSVSLEETPSTTNDTINNFCVSLTLKKLKIEYLLEEIKNLDLEELLKQTLEGSAVLRCYQLDSKLTLDDEDILTAIVIDWLLLRYTGRATVEILISLKDKIVDLFPNEDGLVYYVRPKQIADKSTAARGKLYHRFKNRRVWMVKKRLLLEEELDDSVIEESCKGISVAPDAENVETSIQTTGSMKWLDEHREPQDSRGIEEILMETEGSY